MKSIVAFWMTLAVTAALSGCAVGPVTTSSSPSIGTVVGPGPETTVCCHEFPEVLSERVHPVLTRIPGVTRLQRVNTTDGTLCYRFHYEGPLESLEARLASELRTSSTLVFGLATAVVGHPRVYVEPDQVDGIDQ